MNIRPDRPGRPQIVVVGSSTGGPAALKRFLGTLPATFPLPILVAQHLPAEFTGMLVTTLRQHIALPVSQARDNEMLTDGRVLVCPGGNHMTVTAARTVRLTAPKPDDTICPSVDQLFISAATTYRQAVLAVVLTGMGSDGLAGAKHIITAGGSVIVQDETSSVIWGMPGAIAAAGIPTISGTPEALGREIANRARPA
jgi:two-component system, chemotaxis family, protein-glutamate methylesterase/glutaminase